MHPDPHTELRFVTSTSTYHFIVDPIRDQPATVRLPGHPDRAVCLWLEKESVSYDCEEMNGGDGGSPIHDKLEILSFDSLHTILALVRLRERGFTHVHVIPKSPYFIYILNPGITEHDIRRIRMENDPFSLSIEDLILMLETSGEGKEVDS